MSSYQGKKKPQSQQQQSMQNIKVVVRVRPLTKNEEKQNIKSIIKCHTHRDMLVRDKVYTFDRVFKQTSTQMEVYANVVAPLIKDVVAGYNCTVFAYGQTGTGKTYTMTGDKCTPNLNWKEDEDAGIIPRAAFHIFDELNKVSNAEINVKISFMELYNEEIRDLLGSEDGLQLFNDTKGGLIVHGLTENSVHNGEDICKLLQCGIVRRQIASTLMNSQSSRSHSVFTITVHTTERTTTGNDILKVGKINLVDLAGSENIAKSGCKDLRAQELANINRSLLTLGRVIQALSDKAQKHVPYRDSKLTRILQDSLGGHTKTVIIATVSPAHTSQEETINTLEYATRARDIKNTPTINEKLSKNEIIEGLVKEIDRLQKDLDAARSGTGFYVAKESFQILQDAIMAVTGEQISPEELAVRKAVRIKSLEKLLLEKVKVFEDTVQSCKKHREELENAKRTLKEKDQNLETERFLAQWYEKHSSVKNTEAQNLLKAAHLLSNEKEILLAKLEHQFSINSKNESAAQNTVKTVLSLIDKHSEEVSSLKKSHENGGTLLHKHIKTQIEEMENVLSNMKSFTNKVDVAAISDFSVYDTIGKSSAERIGLIKEKIVECQEISNHSESRIQQCNNIYKSGTEQLLTSATKSIESQNTQSMDNNNSLRQKLNTVLDGLRLIEEKDTESLRHLQILTRITEEKSQARQDMERHCRSILEETHCWDDKISQLAKSNVNQLEDIAKVSMAEVGEIAPVPFKEELMKLDEAISHFQKELEANSHSLDHRHKTITDDTVRSMKSLIDNTCSTVQHVLNENINTLLKDVDDLKQTTNSFDNMYRSLTTNIKGALIQQSLVPATHAGDTPGRNHLNYPTRISETAPREQLIQRFRVKLPNTLEIENNLYTNGISDESSTSP